SGRRRRAYRHSGLRATNHGPQRNIAVRGQKEIVNQNTIRVVVVGVGEFGRNHARVWSEMEGAELVGVVDANQERAAQVAAEFKTRVIRDVYALATEKIDAVSLAIPTSEHSRVGCNLLDSGMDLLVEKPMASTVGEANGL